MKKLTEENGKFSLCEKKDIAYELSQFTSMKQVENVLKKFISEAIDAGGWAMKQDILMMVKNLADYTKRYEIED